jgi:hypothetical protein
MSRRLPEELLQELRTYLQHFDQTGHMGESETVAEIKSRLRQRIGEVEAHLRTTPPLANDREYSPTSSRAGR